MRQLRAFTMLISSSAKQPSKAPLQRCIDRVAKTRLPVLVTGGLVLAACAIPHAQSPRQDAVDNELLAFGRRNPHCQLWTNWRKMCSRTGPNAEAVCVEDPARRVRPSAIFCTAGIPDDSVTPSQIASYRRFCKGPLPQNDGNSLRRCEGADARPFNGRRVAARMHPWCSLWADTGGQLVCQSGDSNVEGVPRCESVLNLETPEVLNCVSQRPPEWCRSAELLGYGPQYPFEGEQIGLGFQHRDPTVVGPYCARTR
jgi:hypothetical protein